MFMASPLASSTPRRRDEARILAAQVLRDGGKFHDRQKTLLLAAGFVSAQRCLGRSVSVRSYSGILIANCIPELVRICQDAATGLGTSQGNSSLKLERKDQCQYPINRAAGSCGSIIQPPPPTPPTCRSPVVPVPEPGGPLVFEGMLTLVGLIVAISRPVVPAPWA